MRTILTTFLLAGAAAICAPAQDFQWKGTLTPGQLIEIRGLAGSIHATGGSDNAASISAVKTAGTSDPGGVQIQLVPFDGGLAVCTIYPDAGQANPNQCNPPGQDVWLNKDKNNDVRVDFTVTVPQGVRFTAITLDGDIDAESMTGDVEADTLSGNITISTAGSAQANSLRGSVIISMGSANWMGLHSVTAENGSIDIQLPADANVSINADVMDGSLTSDSSLNIMKSTYGSFAMANGALGSGGRSLRLFASRGNITIHKGPPSSGQ